MNKISRKIHKRRKCATTCKKYRASSNRKRRTRRYGKGGSGLWDMVKKHSLSGLSTTGRLATNLASTTLKTVIRKGTSEFEKFKNARICSGDEKVFCSKDDDRYVNVIKLLNSVLRSASSVGSEKIKIINERYDKSRLSHSETFRGQILLNIIKARKHNFEVFTDTPHKLPIDQEVTTQKKLFTLTTNLSEQKNHISKLFYIYAWFYEKTNLPTIANIYNRRENNDVIGNHVDTYVSIFVIQAEKPPEALYIAYNLSKKKKEDSIAELNKKVLDLNNQKTQKLAYFELEIDNSTKHISNHNKILNTAPEKVSKDAYIAEINKEKNKITEFGNQKQAFQKKIDEEIESNTKNLNNAKEKLKEINTEMNKLTVSHPNLNNLTISEEEFNKLTQDIFYYVPDNNAHNTKEFELYINPTIAIYKNNQFVIIRLYHDIQLGGTTDAKSNNLFYDYTVATKKVISTSNSSDKILFPSENIHNRMIELLGLNLKKDHVIITRIVNKEANFNSPQGIQGFNDTDDDCAYNYELVLDKDQKKYKLDIIDKSNADDNIVNI